MQKRQITILFSIILLIALLVTTMTACDDFFDDDYYGDSHTGTVVFDDDFFTDEDAYNNDGDDDAEYAKDDFADADTSCIGPDCDDPDCEDCYWDIVYSIDRDFDWYINQLGTGADEYINCGPASAVMAALWYFHGDFDKSVEETRNSAPAILNQHWFYRDIVAFFQEHGVSFTLAHSVDLDYMVSWLEEGRIIIANIRAGDISRGDYESGYDRFYSFEGGHFVILIGYYVVDDVGYFAVYDPFTMHDYYDDGFPMGKNRWYRADEVVWSVDSWGDGQVIIVNNPGQPPTKIGV